MNSPIFGINNSPFLAIIISVSQSTLFNVICVVFSPKLCAARGPTISPPSASENLNRDLIEFTTCKNATLLNFLSRSNTLGDK